jgi:DNA recombination protein RmuC
MSPAAGILASMNPYILLVIGLLAGAVAGYFIGVSRSKSADSLSPELQAQLNAALQAKAGLEATASERLVQIQKLEQTIQVQKDKDLQDNQVLNQLSVTKKQLTDMQSKVEAMEQARVEQQSALEANLKSSIDASNRLSSQTHALAKAMGDNRTRGQWGEIQLERIVEAAGMLNRVDFTTQTVTENEAGSGIKPDLVIHLPGKRAIPVDSKVPFDAYLQAMELDDLTDPHQLIERKRLLDKHVSDLKGHIKALGNKKYWEGFANSADYVIAFIPSENLLAAAMEHDPTLAEYALSNKVALATPMNLFTTLKTVALIWQNTTDQEALNHVIKLGKDLFARLSTVADHASAVGRHLNNSAKAYNQFVSSLERNLFTTAREINKQEIAQFGAVEIKELEHVETTATEFTKFEIDSAQLELDSGTSNEETAE